MKYCYFGKELDIDLEEEEDPEDLLEDSRWSEETSPQFMQVLERELLEKELASERSR
jgi:hypothetical protein